MRGSNVVAWVLALLLARRAADGRPRSFSMGNRPKVKRRWLRAWTASMLASAVFVPGTAAAAVVALYLLHTIWIVNSPAKAYFYGTLLGLLAWAGVLAVFAWRFAWADRANPGVYSNLCEVFDGLHTRLESAADDGPAYREASRHLARLGRGLGLYDDGAAPSADLRWTLAVGYVDLWRNAHRADEALLGTAVGEALVGGVVFDDQRLDGSEIAEARDLRQKLRISLAVLSPNAEVFLNRPPSTPGEEPVVGPQLPKPEAARGVLQIVRRTINEYRDDRRDGLVRVRNNLYATMIFASVLAYTLLGVLMIGILDDKERSRNAVVAGTVFYLTAAVIGLIREIQVVLSSSGTEEDYGLRTARLINIPLFSGLAGIAGVALTALLPATLPETGATSETTPSETTRSEAAPSEAAPSEAAPSEAAPSEAAPSEAATSREVDLGNVFNLGEAPENLVVAAVFGLAPTLLIRGLQRRAEQYKEDLKTTEAGERPTQRTV